MTISETIEYRNDLIAELGRHTLAILRDDRGGFASDRLEAIAGCERDLERAGVDFGPRFDLDAWFALDLDELPAVLCL